MLKILHMPVRNAKGGITQYVLRNWNYIDKSRFCFDWVTLDSGLSFERELREQGCSVYHLSCRQEEDEALFRKEMLEILSHSYDAIHLHTSYWRGFLAEELAIEVGVPKIIVHAHSTGIDTADEITRSGLLQRHEYWKSKFTTAQATHFAACSESAAEFLFGEQIPRERIQILRNTIEVNKYAFNEQARRSKRDELNVDGKFVLLQSGRLEFQKNFDFTLEVFADYAKRNLDSVLLVVGDGSLKSELALKAKTFDADIRFLGFRSDIPELLMASDVFLQPSLFEGFSIASIEAQCSGIPWIVSDRVPEAALPLHKTALPLHKAAWIDMLDKIAKKTSRNYDAPEQLRELGWDLKDQVRELEKLYEELVDAT